MEISNTIDTSSINNELMKSKLSTFSGLQNTVGKNMTDAEKTELAKAARGFEAIFVNMMMKEMKAGQLEDDKDGDGGFGADTLKGYMDMQFAEQVSKTGNGIGIAEMIYSQMTGGDKLKAITQEQPAQIIDQLKNLINQKTEVIEDTGIDFAATTVNNFSTRVSDRLSKYQDIISEAAEKYGVSQSLIKGIITAESAGRADAKSAVGAKGLMQLMDGTAKDLGVTNSYDPKQNIMAGTKYIKQQIDKFGSIDTALAAYNAGPGNVQKYGGIPPFKETQNYVEKVKKYSEMYKV